MELKLFALFKNLIRKPFQTFFYPLKNLFEKMESQNIKLHLPKTYANSFAKEILTKGFISNKVCYAKGMFENKFQKLFL
jgi:meiotically up-regulated gene 157 (Mug157) protein